MKDMRQRARRQHSCGRVRRGREDGFHYKASATDKAISYSDRQSRRLCDPLHGTVPTIMAYYLRPVLRFHVLSDRNAAFRAALPVRLGDDLVIYSPRDLPAFGSLGRRPWHCRRVSDH